jgi:hypothetical protein
MIATRFRSIVSTGGACLAILAFYMMSQTVAAKRAELTRVDREIVQTHRAITQLETEIGTRAGMGQIEHWNSSVYGLQAPGVGQFVNSSVQLAAMVEPAPRPLDPALGVANDAVRQASVRLADAAPAVAPVVPVQTVSAPEAQPTLRVATFVQARASALAPSAPSAVHEASLQKPVQLAVIDTPPAPKAVVKQVAAAKPARATKLDDAWLDDITGGSAARPARKARP